MITDAIADYQGALRSLDEAETALRRQLGVIITTAHALRDHWKRVVVSNVQIDFPAEVADAPGLHSIDGETWPTAKQLGQAFANWHYARNRAEIAWRAIPEDRRLGIEAPPPT